MRVALTLLGALLGAVVAFIGWAPARTINAQTYVSLGLGLLIGGSLFYLLARRFGRDR